MPRDREKAIASGFDPLCLFYRFDDNGRLYRTCDGGRGIMGIYGKVPSAEHLRAAAASVRAELRRGRFGGLLLDTEGDAQPLVSHLKGNIPVFMPAESCVPGCIPVFPSAVSGGSFLEMLSDVCAVNGAENTCIEIVRRSFTFTMPMDGPEGEEADDTEAIIAAHGGSSFLCQSLCCRYYTWRDGDKLRCLFYDDESSLALMLDRCRAAGVGHVMLLCPDWPGLTKESLVF